MNDHYDSVHSQDNPPGRKKLTPLKQRIVDLLHGKGEVSYWSLAYNLWPPKEHPRAWRHSTRGGPHGWALALGRALTEMERSGIVQERLRTPAHPERTVYLKTPAAAGQARRPASS